MAVKYREQQKQRTKFGRFDSDSTWGDQPSTVTRRKTETLTEKADRKKSRKGVIERKRRHRNWVNELSASSPVELDRIVTASGTIYPLRIPITVVVKHAIQTAEAFIQELKWLEPLIGKGASDERALAALIETFHLLVDTHHRRPLHLRTEEDHRINRVLDHLVDWQQYEIENPIDQPLWGRIGQRDGKGNLVVLWIDGPCGESNQESQLSASDVVEEFHFIGEGHWFYGAGRVFPNGIQWTSRPVQIPDPHDETLIKAAWDLIPAHVMSDLAAWPLKTRD